MNKMEKNEQQPNIVIYTTEDGQASLQVKIEKETVWLTQKQMSELFQCSTDNIGLHLKNIFKEEELTENSVAEEYSVTAAKHILNDFKEGELDEKAVCREFRRTGSDGKDYGVKHYNLDVIISTLKNL